MKLVMTDPANVPEINKKLGKGKKIDEMCLKKEIRLEKTNKLNESILQKLT